MMIDPIVNFLNALLLIFQNLPAPFVSLVGVVAVVAVVLIVIKVVRGL